MVNKELLNEINIVYQQLEVKKAQIAHALAHRVFEIESGWYNGHYQKNDAGEWCRDSYPIPVISVKGLCDIEIQFEKISVSAKLKRGVALTYSFDKMLKYEFEAYGVEDYLADYYHTGLSIQDMRDNINHCEETEIGFSFTFPFEAEGKELVEFVKLLRREGFYY